MVRSKDPVGTSSVPWLWRLSYGKFTGQTVEGSWVFIVNIAGQNSPVVHVQIDVDAQLFRLSFGIFGLWFLHHRCDQIYQARLGSAGNHGNHCFSTAAVRYLMNYFEKQAKAQKNHVTRASSSGWPELVAHSATDSFGSTFFSCEPLGHGYGSSLPALLYVVLWAMCPVPEQDTGKQRAVVNQNVNDLYLYSTYLYSFDSSDEPLKFVSFWHSVFLILPAKKGISHRGGDLQWDTNLTYMEIRGHQGMHTFRSHWWEPTSARQRRQCLELDGEQLGIH